MIPPRKMWALQVDITNVCPSSCSNCTRLCPHQAEPYVMDLATVKAAFAALAEFPTDSEPDLYGRRKVVGICGGEPLSHPQFPEIVEIACQAVPQARHRGLWTSVDYPAHRFADAVTRLLGRPTDTVRPVPIDAGGYLNWNRHQRGASSMHQPVLVAIREVVRNEDAMWRLIDSCPLQREWSGSITPKGFFFCEVAGAMDWLFKGPGGMPITPGCWRHDLADYREQIERFCPQCGVCLPLLPRRDRDRMDDVSPGMIHALQETGSPRMEQGRYVVYNVDDWQPPEDWEPLRYRLQ